VKGMRKEKCKKRKSEKGMRTERVKKGKIKKYDMN
jgi:hypothetical protein